MRCADTRTRELVAELVRSQARLLDALPRESDEVEIETCVDGRPATVRVFWGRCVLVAQRGRPGEPARHEDEAIIRLPAARSADAG